MQHLKELFKRHSIKHDRKIKGICKPLKDSLDVPMFTYYFIETNGHFGCLNNHAQQSDFFFSEEHYISHPYFKHPHLLRTGCTFAPAITDPNYQEISDKRFKVHDLLYMLQKRGESLEVFTFGIPPNNPNSCANFYLKNLDLFNKFILYFKREAKQLIEHLKKDDLNIKEAMGELFCEGNASYPLVSNDPKVIQFSKAISPLSGREQECLEMYKQGHSAQSTAAMLGLSQRTIEHYFENMKNKLDCNSKRDLLSF